MPWTSILWDVVLVGSVLTADGALVIRSLMMKAVVAGNLDQGMM